MEPGGVSVAERSNTTDRPVFLLGFAESLATPEVCFSLRSTGARIVCFHRARASAGFARLNFVEYCPVTAPETDFNQSIVEIGALVSQFRPDVVAPCDDTALFALT